MPQTVVDLGRLVKQKYPGSYDSVPDADLGRKVKLKYPGSYDQFADAPAAVAPTKAAPSAWDRTVSAFGEFTNPLGDPEAGVPIDEKLKRLAEGIASIPGQTSESLTNFGKALATGDLPGAAWHLAGAVPILGPMSQQITNDIAEGKIPEAIGHGAAILAGMGMHQKAPAAAAEAVDQVKAAVPVVQDAVKGGLRGGAEMTHRRVIPIPASMAGAGAGAFAAREVGLPPQVGAVVGAMTPVVRGAVREVKAGIARRAAPMAAAAAAEDTAALDAIAQSLARKKFADLSESEQSVVRNIAAADAQKASTPAPTTPGSAPAASEPLPPAAPGKTILEMLDEELAAKRKPATARAVPGKPIQIADNAPAAAPAPEPLPPALAPYLPRVEAPGGPATLNLADAIRNPEIVRAPEAVRGTAPEAIPPTGSPVLPEANSQPVTQPIQNPFEVKARAKKVQTLAQYLYNAGVPSSSLRLLEQQSAKDLGVWRGFWNQVTADAGTRLASEKTVAHTLQALEELEAQSATPRQTPEPPLAGPVAIPQPQPVAPGTPGAAVAEPIPAGSAPALPVSDTIPRLGMVEAPPAPAGPEVARGYDAARTLAQTLYHDGQGIPVADVKQMDPRMWAQVAQGLGLEAPGPRVVAQAIRELERMERAGPVARQLADEMAVPPTETAPAPPVVQPNPPKLQYFKDARMLAHNYSLAELKKELSRVERGDWSGYRYENEADQAALMGGLREAIRHHDYLQNAPAKPAVQRTMRPSGKTPMRTDLFHGTTSRYAKGIQESGIIGQGRKPYVSPDISTALSVAEERVSGLDPNGGAVLEAEYKAHGGTPTVIVLDRAALRNAGIRFSRDPEISQGNWRNVNGLIADRDIPPEAIKRIVRGDQNIRKLMERYSRLQPPTIDTAPILEQWRARGAKDAMTAGKQGFAAFDDATTRRQAIEQDLAKQGVPAAQRAGVLDAAEQAYQSGARGDLSARLQATADAASQRMRKRGSFSGTKLNSMPDPADLKDLAIWGAAKLAYGTVEFGQWSREMVKEFGSQVKPHLDRLYFDARKIFDRHVEATANDLPATKELLRRLKAGQDGAEWYDKTHSELVRMFGRDADMMEKFLAATSFNNTVAGNVTQSLKAYRQWRTGQPFKGFLPAHQIHLEKAVAGEVPAA